MSYASRPNGLPSHIRPSSGLANPGASTQSSALQARINEKKAELESLKQLRDLSAGLAGQMQQLEDKLSTLSNGTQAVAEVLGNWNHVLRAIHMASASIPRPKDAEDEEKPRQLPQTLVRIPVQQAEAAQREAEDAGGE
ncbi:DASH complex subunit dad2 [Vermiconidia calcicola]|uniref:DASH complex subunit dad2 n=1 Tax=Vermiconidia calcicola TaxID=1690605 RepID=A0ACC3NTB5_9PEZI|nr:DASH complex subunit dad2 [Vermiconidia calcicola]